MNDLSVAPMQADVIAADTATARDGLDPGNFFDSSPIPTFVINADHVVTHVNRAYAKAMGVRPQDVIGTRSLGRKLYGHNRPILADLVLDPSLADQMQALYGCPIRPSVAAPDALQAEAFFAQLGEDGRWLFLTTVALRDSQGHTVGVIQTVVDITDRKRAEQALVQAQQALNQRLAVAYDQLVQSEKLASIGQLAAGVAHEINNPIGYVFSNFSTLEKYLKRLFEMLAAYEMVERTQFDDNTRNDLQALRQRLEVEFLKEDIPALMRESREGIARVRKIVQDLKDFSHVDASAAWQFSDLVHCISSTLNVVNNEIKYKADVVREFVQVPDVECNASEINQVIMNLLINAAQAIGPERGTITIRNGTDGALVWFEVADTGSGIEKTSLARIFDPFYTTKPVGQGTGLGLSISYGIVRKHHGQILVHTTVGQGTTFRVELPIVQPVPDAAEMTCGP